MKSKLRIKFAYLVFIIVGMKSITPEFYPSNNLKFTGKMLYKNNKKQLHNEDESQLHPHKLNNGPKNT